MITGKKEMENYLHFEAINQAYAKNGLMLGLTSNFADFDDVPEVVAQRVHGLSGSPTGWSALDEEHRGSKVSSAKGVLNGVAAGLMTKPLLVQVDKANEVVGWFKQMKGLIS